MFCFKSLYFLCEGSYNKDFRNYNPPVSFEIERISPLFKADNFNPRKEKEKEGKRRRIASELMNQIRQPGPTPAQILVPNYTF